MKTKILKIEKANALEVYEVAPENFKPTLEKLFGFEIFQTDPKKFLKDFSNVLKFHKKSDADFDGMCKNLRPHQIGALREEMIVAAYNGRHLDDPLPDFTDGKLKYYPRFVMGSPSGVGFSYLGYGHWFTVSGVGARLVSESRKSAEHIGELFHEDFKKMKVYERKIQK